MADSAEVYIGVDIGGTKVAAGLVNTQGEILHKTRTPMHARGTADEALVCVRAAIDALRQSHPDVKVGGIGLISPGPVDPQTGMVLNPSNLPCWHNYPLADQIRKAYDLPTHVHNDANAAGLAEALWGAGAGYKCMFYRRRCRASRRTCTYSPRPLPRALRPDPQRWRHCGRASASRRPCESDRLADSCASREDSTG